jgi:hypothetical protein
MKRCSQCYQPYPDSEKFCELDGQPLFEVPVTAPVGKVADSAAVVPGTSSLNAPVMVIVGVMVGILLTSLVYAGYMFFTAEPPAENLNPQVSRVDTPETQQPRRAPRAEVVEPSPAPTQESSPSPEPAAEPKAAATEDTTTARLNQGPVSTGERKLNSNEQAGDKTIIEMTDGTNIEVDAAWQDKQGIWYRRGGLVSFIESKRIKGIQTPRQESKPDSSGSTTP